MISFRKTAITVGMLSIFLPQITLAADVPANAIPMTSIIKKLQENGYKAVNKIKFDDGVYEVEGINVQGKDIEANVDPVTGAVTKTKGSDMTLTIMDAAGKVEKAGYHNIYYIDRSGKKYEVKALDKDGKKVSLDVDGNTGEISSNLF